MMCRCGHNATQHFPLTCECAYCGCPEFRAAETVETLTWKGAEQ